MPQSHHLTRETFLHSLRNTIPEDSAGASSEVTLFEISSRLFQLECADGSGNAQVTVTLVAIDEANASSSNHPLQFDTLPNWLRWLQSFARDNFAAVTRLESHSKQRLTLRISSEDTQRTEQRSINRLPVEMYGNNQRILLVEDEENVRFILAAMLRNLNYSVTSCCDGLDALHELRNSEYDLVLVDAVIPRLGGPELIRRCREQNPATRTVLMTAFRRDDSPAEGAEEILYKPFDMHSLAARLKRELPPGAEGETTLVQ